MLRFEDRFDSLIQYHCERLRAPFPWILIKAQIRQESGFRPMAESHAGARGLMQLMPGTDLAIDGDLDGFDIEGNLDNGIRYLIDQYSHFPEIPDPRERIKFSLAAYNGGRGYINVALKLAYEFEHSEPMDYGRLKPGRWQQWVYTKEKLKSSQCFVEREGMRLRPEWSQIIGYVAKIWGYYEQEYPRRTG